MFKLKRAFFQWMLINIVICSGIYYAYLTGYTNKVFIDKTNISWILLGFILLTDFHMGITSWRLDYISNRKVHLALMWPSIAIATFPLGGMLGSVSGFISQSDTLMSGTAGLGPLGTSLFATWFGIIGAIITIILLFNIRYCHALVMHDREDADFVKSREKGRMSMPPIAMEAN